MANNIVNNSEATYNIERNNKAMEKYFTDSGDNRNSGNISFWFPAEKGERILAHKITLASQSDVFHRMFYGDGEFKRERKIKIFDASVAEFVAFLRYFYCTEMKVTNGNVAAMMYLAEKYDVDDVLRFCEDFLKKTSFDDTVTAYRLANTFRRYELTKFLEERIRKQANEFFASAQIGECSSDELKAFLQLDGLNCDGKAVFDGLMLWSQTVCVQKGLDASDKKTLRAQLGDCFKFVPFRSMKPKQISKIVQNHYDLFKSNEMIDIVRIMAGEAPVTLTKFIRKTCQLSGQKRRHIISSDSEDEFESFTLSLSLT